MAAAKLMAVRRVRVAVLGLALVLALAALAPARTAWADESAAHQRAEALFNDGRLLAKSGYYAQACLKFEQSLALNAGMGTEFHLAECSERIGQTERARHLFLDVAARAHAAGQADREQLARERAAALEPANAASKPVASEPMIIVGTVPAGDGAARVEPARPDAPEAVLNEEASSLAEATVGVRALEQSAAALAAAAPADLRVKKARRELAALEAELVASWLLAGQVQTQLARRALKPSAPAAKTRAELASPSPAASAEAVASTPSRASE